MSTLYFGTCPGIFTNGGGITAEAIHHICSLYGELNSGLIIFLHSWAKIPDSLIHKSELVATGPPKCIIPDDSLNKWWIELCSGELYLLLKTITSKNKPNDLVVPDAVITDELKSPPTKNKASLENQW